MTPLILSMLKKAELFNIFGDTVKLVFFSELFEVQKNSIYFKYFVTFYHFIVTFDQFNTHTHTHTQYYTIILY